MAVHFLAWVTSLSYTSVGSSMMTFGTQPIFASIIAHFFLGEKFRKSAAIALAIALVGVSIIAAKDYAEKETSVIGVLLALVGAVTMASILCIARVLRRKMRVLPYATTMYLTAGIVLLPGVFLVAGEFPGYAARQWLFLALIIALPQLTGHTLLNWVMKYLKALTVNLSMLVEPVVATIFAMIILGERQTWPFFLGAALILGGVTWHLITEKPAPGPPLPGPENL
jgi:drug/metabolite transporter (DMT)-like permease